jgi:hypothetical protein
LPAYSTRWLRNALRARFPFFLGGRQWLDDGDAVVQGRVELEVRIGCAEIHLAIAVVTMANGSGKGRLLSPLQSFGHANSKSSEVQFLIR